MYRGKRVVTRDSIPVPLGRELFFGRKVPMEVTCMKLTGGQIVCESLLREGVEVIFGMDVYAAHRILFQ